MLDELIGFGTVCCPHGPMIPLKLLAAAEGDIAQEDGFAQRPRVVEATGGRSSRPDRVDPLPMMAFGILNEGRWPGKVPEFVFWKQGMISVIGDKLAFRAHKKNAGSPLLVLFRGQDVVRVAAVIPGKGKGLPVPTGHHSIGKLVMDLQPGRGGILVNGWALSLRGDGMAQVECPEGKVHVVTSDISKGASAKVPPMPPMEVCPAGVVGLFRDLSLIHI